MRPLIASLLVTALTLASTATSSADPARADTIYFGGDILTMNPAQPGAEALAVKDGKIARVGEKGEVLKLKGSSTQLVDLRGKTLLPGFIDPHSHFINSLAMSTQRNVSSPPVGPASNPAEIVAELQKYAQEKGIQPGEIVMGYGYDENQMPPGQSLTREQLDAAFPANPVLVMHVSLHGAVLNSAAFKKYGISAATKTPAGGIILRKPGSQEPAGLVMETAFLPVFAALPKPTRAQEIEQLKAGQKIYAAAGVTTANDGASHADQIELLKRGAAAKALFIDVIALPFITDLDEVLKKNPASSFGRYNNGLKLGGCKITMDGSPQGRTANFTTPYLSGGPGGEKNWHGEPTFSQESFNAMLKKCYDNKLQAFLHANGDAAIDMILKGHETVAAGQLAADRRSTVIHSQFVRPDQIDKYVAYRLIPSLYTEHTYFFADTHVKNRGPQQAAFMSPLKTIANRGLRPTNHTDFNVAPIDQMMVLWSAVNRVSRSGEVIGPDERVTPIEALKAITIDAAHQYFEEDSKGSLEPGKLADLVILDANPIKVQPMAIKDIKVLKTIKRGQTIYQALK